MRKPHNPGLSEKAWDNLHLFIAKVQIEYAKELAEKEKQLKEVRSIVKVDPQSRIPAV